MRSFNMVEDPFDFCGAEICVNNQTGIIFYVVLQSCLNQLFTDGGSTAALPYNSVIDRLAGMLVPDNGGFPLVSNTDCGYFICRDAAH